jgi:hypothetical protein
MQREGVNMSILQELTLLTEAQSWVGAAARKPVAKWTPPEGFFDGSAASIVAGLMKASNDQKQAMARLNFYINRAGKNLNPADKARLESAKTKLEAKGTKD